MAKAYKENANLADLVEELYDFLGAKITKEVIAAAVSSEYFETYCQKLGIAPTEIDHDEREDDFVIQINNPATSTDGIADICSSAKRNSVIPFLAIKKLVETLTEDKKV